MARFGELFYCFKVGEIKIEFLDIGFILAMVSHASICHGCT